MNKAPVKKTYPQKETLVFQAWKLWYLHVFTLPEP